MSKATYWLKGRRRAWAGASTVPAHERWRCGRRASLPSPLSASSWPPSRSGHALGPILTRRSSVSRCSSIALRPTVAPVAVLSTLALRFLLGLRSHVCEQRRRVKDRPKIFRLLVLLMDVG